MIAIDETRELLLEMAEEIALPGGVFWEPQAPEEAAILQAVDSLDLLDEILDAVVSVRVPRRPE